MSELRSVLLMTAAVILPVHAQQAPRPSIRTVTHYTIKTDRTGDMAAAIKEYNGVLKKALWDKTYTIWRSVTGPSELIRVDYFEKWAELDSSTSRDPKLKEYQAELTRIMHRINESFQGSTRVVDMVNQEISLPRPEQRPKMLMVWTAHVRQGKMQEAIALEKNEYAPALKSAGVKSYIFARARFGAPSNEIRSSTGLESWAELDQANPVRKVMGDEKYSAFTAKMNAILDDYHYDIYRYDPELSYIASK
jgi:hypothetical protein